MELFTEDLIGRCVRKSTWRDCVLHVVDVGRYSLIGTIVDLKKNKVVVEQAVYPQDEDWQVVMDETDIWYL